MTGYKIARALGHKTLGKPDEANSGAGPGKYVAFDLD